MNRVVDHWNNMQQQLQKKFIRYAIICRSLTGTAVPNPVAGNWFIQLDGPEMYIN